MDSYLQAFTKSIKERTITILKKKKKKAKRNSEFMTCRNTKNKHQNPDLQTQGNFLVGSSFKNSTLIQHNTLSTFWRVNLHF
jgi:hypothetical protein